MSLSIDGKLQTAAMISKFGADKLTTENLSQLDASQAKGLTAAQLKGFKSDQIAALEESVLVTLSGSQISALNRPLNFPLTPPATEL